jgi:hypothetical protein
MLPIDQMLESITQPSTLTPIYLASKASNRVPKEIKPLDLPSELPDSPMDCSDIMNLFSSQILSSYYGNDLGNFFNEDGTIKWEEEVQSALESSTMPVKYPHPKSCLPWVLGDGLGVMINNPKFARFCNPLDTEFEIRICDSLAQLFGIQKWAFYENNGLGIINGNEMDGLLALVISAKFWKRGDESIDSDKYVIYASEQRMLESYESKQY